jgi:hypothetical protein
MRRRLLPVLALAVALAPASSAAACLTVGVYQDSPAAITQLARATGPGITTLSTYVTGGQPLAQSVIDAANKARARLLVTWEPDDGTDGASQPQYRLRAIAAGRYDKSLKALVAQLRTVRRGAILRPMPEMNTPWYAWSGAVNGNTPSQFVTAWRRVGREVRAAPGGARIKLLWAPYAQSIPDTSANAIGAYFPGASQVDLVGASGYNFGAQPPLGWTAPGDLFAPAYSTIEALAPKPFWLAETGSTATGGDKAGWIASLATLTQAMPKLAGVVWYDIDDPDGDFRLSGTGVIGAFKSLLKEACR